MNPSTTTLELTRSYAWGLDLSGSEQGAGGVGGLLLVKTGATLVAPSYDGNGNVTAYLNAQTGALLAVYDYDAFGRVLVKDDSGLPGGDGSLPFQFSTKYTDRETGLSYYGYRYYSAELGRWLNRDPLGDHAFLKERLKRVPNSIRERLIKEGVSMLYLFVGNDSVNYRDWLGLAVITRISVSYESGYPMSNLQNHPFWSQIFGDVEGHSPTGYIYAGYMTVHGEKGKVLMTMPVLTGGYKTNGSTVPDGEDSAIPSDTYNVETKPSGDTRGYLVYPTPGRSLIKIHHGNISAGCIVTVDGLWNDFVKHMEDTNKCKESVALSTSKQF